MENVMQPKPYAVYLIVPAHSPDNDSDKEHWMRIGPANDVAHARRLIKENEAGRRNTFGGLIDGSRGKVTYRVFKAEWTEVEV
jgi:hypothetical protein